MAKKNYKEPDTNQLKCSLKPDTCPCAKTDTSSKLACGVIVSSFVQTQKVSYYGVSQSGGDIILLDNGVSEVAFQVIGDAFEEFNFSSLLL